jgi:hypothetical protein
MSSAQRSPISASVRAIEQVSLSYALYGGRSSAAAASIEALDFTVQILPSELLRKTQVA